MAAKDIPILRCHRFVMGLSKIFRSRWSALFWAAGIVWTAYDVAEANKPAPNAGHHDKTVDVTGTPVDDQDVQALKSLLGDTSPDR